MGIANYFDIGASQMCAYEKILLRAPIFFGFRLRAFRSTEKLGFNIAYKIRTHIAECIAVLIAKY